MATRSPERKSSVYTSRNGKLPERPHSVVTDEGAVERKYILGKILGQGSFGVVREATSRTSGEHLAVKIVHKDKPGSRSILMLAREVEVLKSLDHPHIISLEEVLETPKNMYLVMELCTGGELTTRLRHKGYFREVEAKEVMRQLTEVVVYLHDNDIVHRDLKLENVLLKSLTDDDISKLHIKVTDFGLAHMRTFSDKEDPMDQCCGTPYYMAPEVIYNKHEYTKMCDVWSLGVIMFYLLCGKVPFQSDKPKKLEKVILRGDLKFTEVEWNFVSDKGKDLIKGMLVKDTTHRLTARRVLNDSWFTGQSSNFLSAIDLMRDLTGDSESRSIESFSSKPLNTISETHTTSREHLKSHLSAGKPLSDKRSKSSISLSPSQGVKLKSSSSSSFCVDHIPKQRSHSVGTRPSAKKHPELNHKGHSKDRRPTRT